MLKRAQRSECDCAHEQIINHGSATAQTTEPGVYAIAKNGVSWYIHKNAGYEALKHDAVPTKALNLRSCVSVSRIAAEKAAVMPSKVEGIKNVLGGRR